MTQSRQYKELIFGLILVVVIIGLLTTLTILVTNKSSISSSAKVAGANRPSIRPAK